MFKLQVLRLAIISESLITNEVISFHCFDWWHSYLCFIKDGNQEHSIFPSQKISPQWIPHRKFAQAQTLNRFHNKGRTCLLTSQNKVSCSLCSSGSVLRSFLPSILLFHALSPWLTGPGPWLLWQPVRVDSQQSLSFFQCPSPGNRVVHALSLRLLYFSVPLLLLIHHPLIVCFTSVPLVSNINSHPSIQITTATSVSFCSSYLTCLSFPFPLLRSFIPSVFGG